MERYYLAIDIGASSGRHMLASMKDGKMQLEEVYRFPNGMDDKNGTLCWNVERLFTEIKNGLKKCKEIGSSRFPWQSTHGALIMCCLIRMTGYWVTLWGTETAAQRGWMRRCMR